MCKHWCLNCYHINVSFAVRNWLKFLHVEIFWLEKSRTVLRIDLNSTWSNKNSQNEKSTFKMTVMVARFQKIGLGRTSAGQKSPTLDTKALLLHFQLPLIRSEYLKSICPYTCIGFPGRTQSFLNQFRWTFALLSITYSWQIQGVMEIFLFWFLGPF